MRLNQTTLLVLDRMIYATGLIGTWCYEQRSKKILIVKKESEIPLKLSRGRAERQIDLVNLTSFRVLWADFNPAMASTGIFDETGLTLKFNFFCMHVNALSVCTKLALRPHVCCRHLNHKSHFKKEVITHFTVSSPAHNCISNLHVKVTAWVRSEFDFALTRYLTTQTDRCEAQWSTSLGLTLSSAFQN